MSHEVNLLATFTLPENAHHCQDALRDLGFEIVQIDRMSPGPGMVNHAPLVEWGRYGYQPDTLDDKWTAASAWENEGGLIAGESWLLTAVVPDQDVDQARQTIERYGGQL